ncbi:MAG: hypothetical protein ACT4QG_10895 [Sporichthyaceae bacterium]
MIDSVVIVAGPVVAREPDGSVLDILMLQLHVAMTSLWAISAILAGLVAIPQLRRIPSALGLHVLQEKRDLLVNALWGTYLLAFSTGTYLMFKQAAYDPPFSGSDFDELETQPYGVPYYYALYAKIALFVVMGVASFLLVTQARRVAQESEESGGPVDLDLDDDDAWLDEEVLPEGSDELGVDGSESTTLVATRTQALRRGLSSGFGLPVLWSAFVTIVVGLLLVGLCVTLIKYFHELSRAAVVYEILKRS